MEMGEEGNPKRRSGPMVDIYFQVHGEKYMEEAKWIKLTKSSYWNNYIEVEVPPLPEAIESPKFVSLGSKIYASGGYNSCPGHIFFDFDDNCSGDPMTLTDLFPSDKVFYFDTCHPKDGWRAAAPMNKKRMYHYMLVDAGKIYVLGGHDTHHRLKPEEKRLFAEVYDPNSNTWEELAYVGDDINLTSLPQPIDGHAVVDHGVLGRKILFHAYCSQSLFYLNTRLKDDVDVYDGSFGRCHFSSAFQDGVLYFFSRKGMYMYAYDVYDSSLKVKYVVLRNVMKDTLPRLVFGSDFIPTGRLLSLGNGHLALIWYNTPEYGGLFYLHCSILEMTKEGDSIVGTVLNCSRHTVRGGTVVTYLAVSSPEMDVGGDAELGHMTESSNKQRKRTRMG